MEWLAFLEDMAIECVLSPDQKRAFLARFNRANAGKTEKWIVEQMKDARSDLMFSGEAAYKKLMTAVYKAFQVSLFPELATIAKGKREKLEALLKAEFERRSAVSQSLSRSELQPESPVLPMSGMQPGAPLPGVRLPDNFVARPEALNVVKTKLVLMLPASPDSAKSQRWINESREIRKVSDTSDLAVKLNIEKREEATPSDVANYFAQIQPDIVHISGETDGIIDLLVEEDTKNQKNSNEIENLIGDFLKSNAQKVKCVVLSGCCSKKQIRIIVYHIEFVVSIGKNIESERSENFINTFYYHIRSGKSISESYWVSLNLLQRTTKLQQCDLPEIFTKEQERKTRKLESQVVFYKKEIEDNPGNSALWKRLAELLEQLNLTEEMNEAYEYLASLEPKKYENRFEQGEALERLGDHEKGKSAYDKAIELEETDYKVWWRKANAHSKAKEYEEAKRSYIKTLELIPPSPDNYVICTEYAVTLGKLQQFRESIQPYSAALCLQPNYRVARYHRNKMYKKRYSE